MKNLDNLSTLFQQTRCLVLVVIFSFLGSSCSMLSNEANEDGQCWSRSGGVGNLVKNSATKAECEELGGKSWCRVAGGCENIP
jgi:hypothetical protein